MYMAYLDEAGGTGTLPSHTSKIQPVFIPAAMICEQNRVRDLTMDFLHLKQRFFPGLVGGEELFLDRMLAEIKGNDLRKSIRKGNRRNRRQVLWFLEKLLDLLERHEVRLVGRVWVKAVGQENKGKSMYTFSMQDICATFQRFLSDCGSHGLVIADSRNHSLNTNVSHSIFTKKFSSYGDSYDRLLEMPTFGHSDNHAGLQIADLICSALLFPIVTFVYCYGILRGVHVHGRYGVLKERFAQRLRGMLYTYRDETGKLRGGITVSDGLRRRPSGLLWR